MTRLSKYTTHSYAVLDGQFGSTGKGLLAGYLAETRQPTAVVSAFSPNAGHTYITEKGFKFVVTQIPIGSISPRLRGIFIGPGSVVNPITMCMELENLENAGLLDLEKVELVIHSHAAVVNDADIETEKALGLAKIGSTLKGSMAAVVRKMGRRPDELGKLPIAYDALRADDYLGASVVSDKTYQEKLSKHGYITQIEGAQGFSLSLNHGFYPYCTSRNCTPAQLFNDCAIPWDMAKRTEVYQTLRTFPIRVNDREGSSGPGYSDQIEVSWSLIGVDPELTTVTKLPRRVFTWSRSQFLHMVQICGVPDAIFLNFINYIKDPAYFNNILKDVRSICGRDGVIQWYGTGPDFNGVLDVNNMRHWPDSDDAVMIKGAGEEYRLTRGD